MDKKTFDKIATTLPSSKEEAWVKYPKLNWVYNTSRLLDFQEITWYPFPVDTITNTAICDTSLHDTTMLIFDTNVFNLSDKRDFIYLTNKIDIVQNHHKVDIVVHKGQPVEELYYMQDSSGNISDATSAPGEIELKFRSLIAWHFDKFCGVISIEYSNNIMLSVDLRANPAAMPIYPPQIAKKIPALYNRRHWPK